MKRFTSLVGGLESTIVFRDSPGAVPLDKITAFKPANRVQGFSIIADEGFNIGEAWFCEDTAAGTIHRIDPENGEAIEFVSSSRQAFLACLTAAAEWSSRHSTADIVANPELIDELEQSLATLDAKGCKQYWSLLIDSMRDYAGEEEEEDLEFKFEAA